MKPKTKTKLKEVLASIMIVRIIKHIYNFFRADKELCNYCNKNKPYKNGLCKNCFFIINPKRK